MSPSEIEPATFRLVVQFLNQPRHRNLSTSASVFSSDTLFVHVSFVVLRAALLMVQVFWFITPRKLVNSYRRLEIPYISVSSTKIIALELVCIKCSVMANRSEQQIHHINFTYKAFISSYF
jgi:hypothetical protein